MPRPTPNNYGLIYTHLIDTNPDSFNLNHCIKLIDTLYSIHIHETGPREGYIMMHDFQGATLNHLMRVPIMTVKKFLFYLQEAMPLRLKQIHIVNAVSWMDKVFALARPFMKAELFQIIHLHQPNSETLYEFVPREFLPADIGGSGPSCQEIQADLAKKMDLYADMLKAEDDLFLVDETKRAGKPKSAGELFGVEGTFKKLDID